MTKKVIEKPIGIDPGLRERLDRVDVSYRESHKDVMCNHDQEQPQDPEILWKWKQSSDNDSVQEFHRFEKNNTGKGMTVDIVNKQFFHTLKQEDLDDSKGEGVHSVGEKMFLAVGTKTNRELRELGVELLTKTDEMEEYYHLIYNPYKGEDGVILSEMITYDEALTQGLPVDVIGNKRGTWTKMYVDTTAWNKNWFNEIQTDVSNYFSSKLGKRMHVTLEQETKTGIMFTEVVKPFKIPCLQPSYADVYENGTFDFFGKNYRVKHLIRPESSSPEMQEFDKNYPKQKALQGLEVKFGDNMALIFEDEKTGFWYHVRMVKMGQRTPRGVLKILVNKSDIITDVSKNHASLLKSDGSFTTKDIEHKEIFKMWDYFYPTKKVKEDDIRDQLIDIMWGNKWPVGFTANQYQQLCDLFQAPYRDFEWARKNITPNKQILNKKFDIWIEEHKHLVELKISEPDGDTDWNQVVAYSQLIKDTKKVTTLGVSKKNGMVWGLNDNYHPDLVSKFTNELNNHETTEHIDWNIADLKFFGLEKLADSYVPVK
tara:strand:- start:1601 stop:3223 length:1623 start_codon:yes stop_codon:yes gene_type:complete